MDAIYSYKIFDRRPKSFTFVASQLVSAYIQNHNWPGQQVIEITSLQKKKKKLKMAAIKKKSKM